MHVLQNKFNRTILPKPDLSFPQPVIHPMKFVTFSLFDLEPNNLRTSLNSISITCQVSVSVSLSCFSVCLLCLILKCCYLLHWYLSLQNNCEIGLLKLLNGGKVTLKIVQRIEMILVRLDTAFTIKDSVSFLT